MFLREENSERCSRTLTKADHVESAFCWSWTHEVWKLNQLRAGQVLWQLPIHFILRLFKDFHILLKYNSNNWFILWKLHFSFSSNNLKDFTSYTHLIVNLVQRKTITEHAFWGRYCSQTLTTTVLRTSSCHFRQKMPFLPLHTVYRSLKFSWPILLKNIRGQIFA